MNAHRWLIKLGRGALGIGVGGLIGAAQYGIVVSGMRHADAAAGLSGIGVAAGAAAEYLLVTLALMFAGCWLLGMRLWGLAGVFLIVVQLLIVSFLFAHTGVLGFHGHRRAIQFPIVAVVAVGLASLWWPRRSLDSAGS